MTNTPTINPPARKFLFTRLSPGVRGLNLLTNYYAALFGLCLFTLVGAIQPFVLTSLLKVPLAEQGRVTGQLGFFQEVTFVLTAGLFGILSDKIGRKVVYIFGFSFIAFGYFLYPSATSINDLMIYRVIVALGASAVSVMFTTVLADYVLDVDRGKASGIQGVCNGIGAILSATVLLKLPDIFQQRGMDFASSIRATFYVAVAIAVISALVMLLGLKSGVAAHDAPHKSFVQLAREGLSAARDPGVRLAYAAAFVSRGDLALVGQFLVLWLNKYGLEKAGLDETAALRQARFGFVIVQMAAFLAAPLVGILTDRLNRALAVAICVGISALGYGSLFFIENPLSGTMKLALLVVGFGELAGAVASQVLIAQQAPRAIRGSVIGVFNFCGALGIMTAFSVGGYLFDHWRESAPFFLFGIFGTIVAIWGFAVHKHIKPADSTIS